MIKKLFIFLSIFIFVGCTIVVAVYHLFPAKGLEFALNMERHLSDLELKEVKLEDLTITYLERPSSGPTIVLLHGFAGDKDNWTRFARFIPDGYRLLIPDLPPFGESVAEGSNGFRVSTQAERVVRFIDHMQVSEFHLAGNSMGGHIASLIALRVPDRLLSLTLIDSAGVEPLVSTEFVEQAKQGNSLLLINDPVEYAGLLAFAMKDPPYIPKRFQYLLGTRLVENNDLFESVFSDLVSGYIPLEDKLDQITVPTLVMWG
ncbi:MAG: alpha/beta fold hydrolase, partial [Pseudomonadota bacterium]